MDKYLIKCVLLLATLMPAALAQTAQTAQQLALFTSTPAVTISPVGEGRQPVLLPAISVTISATAVCDPGWTPRKLSLGVADIRKTAIVPKQPESTEVVFEVEIPQEQLAPVVIENFCLASDQGRAAEPAQLRLAGYMSAQAALRCATEAEEKVSYASRVFDVLLNCASQDVLTTDGDG